MNLFERQPPVVEIIESYESTSHTSSGNLKFFLYNKNDDGTPIMNGVGANSSYKLTKNRSLLLID
ncbi:hypothetical protein DERF_006194 [Dermatophagoides farinae]|uniref:Uncharacterized protein n=1 Tax=Dermatophagoides farinae TaxID=6954 RepID=A0A922I7C1_DERFA|nr:hypothetical protein DERF_006194 [Dermatophagoides farinae]